MASEIRVNKIENRSGLGTVTFADTGVDLAGIVTATTFSGSGASLTALPAAQLSGTLPAISGANLTNLAAANLTGTIADARFPATLPAVSAASLTQIPAANIVGVCTSGLTKTGGFGKILQVVQTIKKDTFSTNTYNNFNEITGLNATITPTASTSKLLIQVDVSWSAETNLLFYGKLYDGSTEITGANATGGSSVNAWFAAYNKASTNSIASAQINHITHSYLHQVSDTNEHTYKLYGNGQTVTFYINRREENTDAGSTSVFTIMEIAA